MIRKIRIQVFDADTKQLLSDKETEAALIMTNVSTVPTEILPELQTIGDVKLITPLLNQCIYQTVLKYKLAAMYNPNYPLPFYIEEQKFGNQGQ